ncbi:hypothetical protein ASF90_05195 [Xanthomonas sp. Leaf148]|nr:hypothetical protein ASF90_05195 [Xanthomonas sp. Leaf148]
MGSRRQVPRGALGADWTARTQWLLHVASTHLTAVCYLVLATLQSGRRIIAVITIIQGATS